MSFTLWISSRLRLRGSGSKANATGMAIAVTGVALAVAIMAITLGVVRGFKQEITSRIMGFEPNISILPAYDYETGASAPFVSFTEPMAQAVADAVPNGKPYLRFTLPGMIKTDTDYAGVYLNAYSAPEGTKITGLARADSLAPDEIIISQSLANKLSLQKGDRPFAYFFTDGAMRTRRFTIADIYSTGFSEYDDAVAFAHLGALQRIAGADSLSATQIAVSAPNLSADEIALAAGALQQALIDSYQSGQSAQLYPVDNVRHTGAVFFNWLQLLDANVVVIFILMGCVAGFTLISSMFILVLDRIATIGLLRSLGATRGQIRDIFASMAMKAVLLGLVIGDALGIGLLLAQERWHLLPLNPEMYYLPHVPVSICWWWMVILNIAVAAVGWALLLIPSLSAAKASPASTMRFE